MRPAGYLVEPLIRVLLIPMLVALPVPTVLGRLAWRLDAAAVRSAVSQHTPLGKQLRNVLQHAREDLRSHHDLAVVSKFERAGVLPTDPRYRASEQAIHDLSILFRFALCSRVAEAALASPCKTAAEAVALRWVGTYVPTGNPINESDLMLLFVSLDLLHEGMSAEQRSRVDSWLRSFLEANDRFYGSGGPNTRVNNWNTWRLAERLFAASVVGDSREVSVSRELIRAQARANLLPPAGWAPNEASYGGFDFRQRDALHYHVYDLAAWTWISLLASSDDAVRAPVLDAFRFLRPFFLGQKQHVEFAGSKVPFDLERRKAGIAEYQTQPWKPSAARQLFRLARSVFPEIREWTGSVVDEEYDPWVKTLAEIQRWPGNP